MQSTPKKISRRDFLRYAVGGLSVLGAGGLVGGLAGCAPRDSSHSGTHGSRNIFSFLNRSPSPGTPSDDFTPDVEIALRATLDEVQILAGPPTTVWRFQAEVLQGRPDAVVEIPDSYLGPTLHFRRGEAIRIHFTHDLDEPSIVHWHGLHVPEAADGHPRFAISEGETFTYEFKVLNRPGTYWYHPHPHGRTGPQAYYGLAGLLIVSDEEEAALDLPEGPYDVPLVIQDRMFDEENQLIYLEGGRGRGGPMIGFLGDRILINGRPNFTLDAATHPYRLRLLNGSNARIYKLAWHDDRPFQVIGTDGGLLAHPVQRPYLTLSPGERVELWADFSADPVGSEIILENHDIDTGETFPIAQVRIAREETTTLSLPTELSSLNGHQEQDAVNWQNPRTFDMEMRHMTWLLNGRTFEMEEVAPNEIVRLGDLEVWEFVNESRHMLMPHPMHVHAVQFQVIQREVLPEFAAQYDVVKDGYVDEGWKDTVLLMPGERVKILMKFEKYTGLFLYHCHNLEHEDRGMMRNFLIEP